MKFTLEPHHRDVPDDELIQDISRVAKELGKPTVTIDQYNENGRFHATTQIRRFGSWFKVLERAGLQKTRNLNISTDDLFENLAELWLRLGRQPKYDDLLPATSRYSGWYLRKPLRFVAQGSRGICCASKRRDGNAGCFVGDIVNADPPHRKDCQLEIAGAGAFERRCDMSDVRGSAGAWCPPSCRPHSCVGEGRRDRLGQSSNLVRAVQHRKVRRKLGGGWLGVLRRKPLRPKGHQLQDRSVTTSPYQDSIVAWIDILGWSDLLRQAKDEAKVARVAQVVRCLEALSKKSRERREEFARRGFHGAANTRFSYFSDTVVLSCPVAKAESGWMIWEVQLLCAVLLHWGQYSRGAIVRGHLHHTETLLYGPAIVDAHEIERDVAKYPRLVVTPEAAPFVVSATDPSKPDEPTDPQWSIDADGLRFLEIFRARRDGRRLKDYQADARRAREIVREDLARVTTSNPNLKLQAKFGWMLGYLDSVLAAEAIPADPTLD
jgi:hypothetical protein